MISATQVGKTFLSIVKIASKDSMSFKFHYMKRVFVFTIEPTDGKYKQPYRKYRRHKPVKGNVDIKIDECECGSIMVNGICSNKACIIQSIVV